MTTIGKLKYLQKLKICLASDENKKLLEYIKQLENLQILRFSSSMKIDLED